MRSYKVLSVLLILAFFILFSIITGCGWLRGKKPVVGSTCAPSQAETLLSPTPAFTGCCTALVPANTTLTPTPVAVTPNLKKRPSLDRARSYLDKGEYEQAIGSLNKIILLSPDEPDAYTYRGLAYIELQDYVKAEVDLKKAIFLNPDDSKARFYMGILKQQTYDDGAIDEFNRAIALDPQNAEAYYRRGLVYYDQKNYKKAGEDFEKAKDIDPDSETGKLADEKIQDLKKPVKKRIK